MSQRFKDHARPDLRYAYLDEKQYSSAWPTSLTIQVRYPAYKLLDSLTKHIHISMTQPSKPRSQIFYDHDSCYM